MGHKKQKQKTSLQLKYLWLYHTGGLHMES